MIDAPDKHRWQIRIGSFDVTLALLARDPIGETAVVTMESSATGIHTYNLTTEQLEDTVEKMAVKILTRLKRANALAEATGIEVLIR